MKWSEMVVRSRGSCCGGTDGPLPRPEWQAFDKKADEQAKNAEARETADAAENPDTAGQTEKNPAEKK